MFILSEILHHATDLIAHFSRDGFVVYPLIAFVSLIESLPIIGTFTPGILLLMFYGFLASHGEPNVALTIIAVVIGAFAGELVGFLIGKYGRHLIKEDGLLKASRIDAGKAYFKKYGGKSVFFGRFIGIVRPIIPLVAGLVDMPFETFALLNLAGATTWATVYVLLGYFFGGQRRLLGHIVTELSIIIGIAAIICIGYVLIVNWRKKSIKP